MYSCTEAQTMHTKQEEEEGGPLDTECIDMVVKPKSLT